MLKQLHIKNDQQLIDHGIKNKHQVGSINFKLNNIKEKVSQ